MDLYRAEAKRRHSGRATTWRGKWRKDPRRAIEQAKRWQLKEPFAPIEVVSTNGMRATLEDMEAAQSSGKGRESRRLGSR
jgi:hypothetical protein